MRSRISRGFIPSGLAVVFILALGLLQGTTTWSVAGLAVLAGLYLRIARFGPRPVSTIRNLQPAARAEPGRSIPKPNRSPYGRAYRLLSALVIAGLLAGVLPPPGPAPAAPAQPARLQAPAEQPAAQPDGRPHRLPPQRPNQTPGTFWADLDGDRDVDEADLQWIALFWNCAAGDACYDAALDFNTDGLIDALDMAYVGNEYDPSTFPTWVNFYGPARRPDGSPLPPGTIVQALDPDGVVCGAVELTTVGQYGLLACYGGDPDTPEDEDARPGDTIRLVVDGQVLGTGTWTAHGERQWVPLGPGGRHRLWLPLLRRGDG